MTRVRLIIQYDGAGYVGWQTQPNGLAVQEVMERELYKLTGEKIALHASGRTDSGVHALAQVAHFDTDCHIPPEKFSYALNAGLPRDIRVQYSEEAPSDFHSRFDAKHKQYRYTVLNAPHADAFLRDRALHVHYRLDFDAMQRAAQMAVGEHDFAAFKAAGSKIDSTVRTIFLSEWSRHGDLLYYNVEGNGFLYNMVRILVGTMLDIGMGRRTPESMEEAVKGAERRLAGPTAPPEGLALVRVRYADFDTAEHVPTERLF